MTITRGFSTNDFGALIEPELRDGFVIEVRWSRAMRGVLGEPRPDLWVEIEARDSKRHRFHFVSVENAKLRDFGVQNVIYEVLVLRDHHIQAEDLHCLIDGFDDDAYSATCLAEMRGKISHEHLVLVVFVPANGAKLSVLCRELVLETQ
ncbi:MAG: hypothetical protein SGI72_13520 [Planctomycetota bacterium]|nr:hypothetical protein [Planctomycetota bacterium]